MATSKRSVPLVVEHTVRNRVVSDETPEEGITPIDDGVDPLETGVAFMSVALGDVAQLTAAGVVLPGTHDNPLQWILFTKLKELSLIVFCF